MQQLFSSSFQSSSTSLLSDNWLVFFVLIVELKTSYTKYETSNTNILRHKWNLLKYSCPLNSVGLNCRTPLTCGCVSVVSSTVLCGLWLVEFSDTEELWLQRGRL